jgi:hypothetical protein
MFSTVTGSNIRIQGETSQEEGMAKALKIDPSDIILHDSYSSYLLGRELGWCLEHSRKKHVGPFGWNDFHRLMLGFHYGFSLFVPLQ